MALKGTLKDFGIADILQLIGQQQKTGELILNSGKGDQVTVSFLNGNIVRAETTVRDGRDLIGSMLLSAELVTESQLKLALERQVRTLQRLGDVLVSQGVMTMERFSEIVRLQASETLFRLFAWKSGSYEFEQRDVDADPALIPLRAESVLMEGFRRVDEWPVIRKRITSLQMSFERLRALPQEPRKEQEEDELDALLAEDEGSLEEAEISEGEFKNIGPNERKCYSLVQQGRTVQKIIELSCLGEFEAVKALCNLVNLDYLKALPPKDKGGRDFEEDRQRAPVLAAFWRIAIPSFAVIALVALVARSKIFTFRLGSSNASHYSDPAILHFAARHQIARLRSAIEIYKLEHFAMPASLEVMVADGYLSENDRRYPWAEDYYYRVGNEGSYLLLPPFR